MRKQSNGPFEGVTATALSLNSQQNGTNEKKIRIHALLKNLLISGRKPVYKPKYLTVPILSDKQCLKQKKNAISRSRLCTAVKDEKAMCSVSADN